MAQKQNSSAGPSQRQQRVAELVRHALAEVLQRGDIQDPVLGEGVIEGPRLRFSRTPPRPTRRAPRIGEHTREVLETLCGFAPAQIDEMEAAGALR